VISAFYSRLSRKIETVFICVGSTTASHQCQLETVFVKWHS